MKAKVVVVVPRGPGWFYEIKFDGYRALAIKAGAEWQLLSRNEKDLSVRCPEIVQDLKTLSCRQVTLDGEIVMLDDRGLPSFQALQNLDRTQPGNRLLFYYVFDVLNYQGRDVRALPIEARREILEEIRLDRSHLRLSPQILGDPATLLEHIQAQGLEGIVAKRINSAYEAGQRSGAWVKYKTSFLQEFVIGGYTQPQGTRDLFGALVVGFYEQGRLLYASKVGTGFNEKTMRDLWAHFRNLVQPQCPFANLPQSRQGRWGQGITASEMRQCTWLRPRLVCAVQFSGWTEGDHLRHPSYKGLREDKSPREVVRESAS